MSCVFQNIDPPPPLRPASVYPPPLFRGEDTLAGWRRGWGVNILEDARHGSVLYLYRILFELYKGNIPKRTMIILEFEQAEGARLPPPESKFLPRGMLGIILLLLLFASNSMAQTFG